MGSRATSILKPLAIRIAGGFAVGALAGAASAVFLYLLDRVTETRVGHPALVYLLPVARLVLGFAYERWGKPIGKGTSLAIERARDALPSIASIMPHSMRRALETHWTRVPLLSGMLQREVG